MYSYAANTPSCGSIEHVTHFTQTEMSIAVGRCRHHPTWTRRFAPDPNCSSSSDFISDQPTHESRFIGRLPAPEMISPPSLRENPVGFAMQDYISSMP